jgi:putative NADPH-quinone reductase
MHVLVVYCHPVETSFASVLHQEVLKNLRAAGHTVDDCDLDAEGFNPVMSCEERLGYHQVPANRAPMAGYVERLQKADALVFCFPTWCFGLPAMLKGFFDRPFIRAAALGGRDHGRPPRRIVTRDLKRLTGNRARTDFHAHDHMNVATEPRLARFKRRVGDAMARFA